MTWFLVDDGFCDHPKVQALLDRRRGHSALALWSLAGSWCSKHLTDGNVPKSVVKRLGFGQSDAKTLVEVRLWNETKDGYVFHDWSDVNPLKEDVLARRNRNKNKVSAWRNRKRNGPPEPDGNPGCNPVTPEVTNRVRDGDPYHTIPINYPSPPANLGSKTSTRAIAREAKTEQQQQPKVVSTETVVELIGEARTEAGLSLVMPSDLELVRHALKCAVQAEPNDPVGWMRRSLRAFHRQQATWLKSTRYRWDFWAREPGRWLEQDPGVTGPGLKRVARQLPEWTDFEDDPIPEPETKATHG